jgi:hypothetical protein
MEALDPATDTTRPITWRSFCTGTALLWIGFAYMIELDGSEIAGVDPVTNNGMSS